MITNRIIEGLSLRETERDWKNPVRLSNSGKCQRAIWYQLNMPDKMIPVSARARLVFRLGDTIESEIKSLIRDIIPNLILPADQEEVRVKVGDTEIIGHIDGRVVVDGTEYILEIKSINALGYKRALKGHIGYSYECQATSYMHGTGIHKTLFLFYCKDTSHLAEVVYEYKESRWKEIEQRFLNALSKDIPEREYNPVNGKLVWQCSYCPAVKLCWPEHEVRFDENFKPQLIVAEHGGKE